MSGHGPGSTVRPDVARRGRTGVPEVVFAESKTTEQCAEAFVALLEAGVRPVIATRVSDEQAAEIRRRVPGVAHDPVGRLLIGHPLAPAARSGCVSVLSGGTSDLPVVAECAGVLKALGVGVRTHVDVGVAGLHRLLDVLPALADADVLIAAAGMEGALPTVLAGLVDQPVIGVPVGVGYGVAAGGHASLHAMLAACAPGLTVVNIDNGFGAAVAAARIIRRVHLHEVDGL